MEQLPNEPFVPPSASAAGDVTLLTLDNWEEVWDTGYGGIPCPPGHYCPAGAKGPQACPAGSVRQATLGRWESDCSICPKGFYCPALALVPEPCPVSEAYGLHTTRCHKQASFLSGCLLCGGPQSHANAYRELGALPVAANHNYAQLELCVQAPTQASLDLGARHLVLQGHTDFKLPHQVLRLAIHARGTNRAFQQADRSCVCLSGFHYIQGKEDLSDQDGVEPCQQTIYDECTEDAVRDSTGACSSSKDICSSQCGPAGGSFSSISGLCSCAGEKSLDEVCDEACRATRPQLILKESKLLIDDPETASGDREFALQDLTTQTGLATGSYECEDKAGCTIRMFDTTLAKMTGLVGVPQSFVDDVTERLEGYGIVPEIPSSGEEEGTKDTEIDARAHTRRLAPSVDFGYFGVSDPVQCLPLGSTVAWHIRPSPNPIYPVYLRNNLLNTNQQFDYGAFRELDTDMKAGEQRILFMFTFKDPGLYVFGLNADQNKILVLRVMEPKRLCRDDALLPQLRTAETLAAISARLPTALETSGWLLFSAVVLGTVLMAVFLFLAAWTVKHQRLEKLETDPKSKYNQRPPKETSTYVIWDKEHDEEREEILSTLLSLLRLRRRDLVNKLAREEKEHQEEEALKGKGEQLLLLRQASGMWSRNDSLVSSIILPAVGEKGQTQISSIKLSVETQIEELLEEFRKARADEDDDMPSIIEIYKARMRNLLEEAQGDTNLAFKSMLSEDIEGHLMTGSALLELREARANLARSEDEAEEQKALEIYRALAGAAWKLTVYTAVIEQEISSSTQAVNRAAFEGKQAVETAKMDSGEAAKALKVAVMGSLKVSKETHRLRDAELESATAALKRVIASRAESVHKRQSAFKSRKLLMLQKRQELAVQHVSLQAQCAVALMRRGLHILAEQLKAATTYETTLFQNVAKFGVDMATLIKDNTEDLSAPATLQDELKTQQGEALAKYRDQLLACLRNQRQEATEELWDLELQERKRVAELLEDQTEQLEVACNKLDEATAKEETVLDEYEDTVLKLRQQNQRGLKELDTIHAVSTFKQKLLSKVNDSFLARANEKEWRLAAAELEPLIGREKETYCRYADLAFQTQNENAMRALQSSRQNRLSQAALTKSMEQAEEEGEEDLLNKRRAMGTDEVQRIVWRICAILSSGGVASAETSKPSLVVPENRQDETIEELRQQLRRRRKKHLAYCIAQRNMIEGSSKSALAILQSETIQGLSDTSEAIEKFSRGSATMEAADSSATILQIMEEAQQKLDKALEEIQKEQEEAEERDRIEREQEIAERRRAHELAKQKLNEEREAKLAQVPDDAREELLKEHELALKQMESTLAAELQEQEERAQRRLLERRQRLQQKRQEAEAQKQKAIEQAKAELEAKIAAEAKQKEEAAEMEELQRLVNQGSNTAAVAQLLARKHDKETASLLQELTMKKAEEISALTENFWKDKGGRVCDGRPDDVQELYKVDDRITLQMQELQQRQAAETEAMMKQMERMAKLTRETELPQMSEEEQYAQLQREAEAAAEEEVGAIEKRMMEEQEKLLKEMEEKRNAYDKVLDKLKHRKQMEEKRRALLQEQEQRKREGQGSALKQLMSQFEEHRKLLEEALAIEAERQHKQARERVLLRNAERADRLYQKRLIEKQRFLVNQNEIKRRELGLNNARAGVRSQRNLVETLNQQELKRRMELAHRLEEERHWAPIWREILEEEQNAGTFDSWDLDDQQISFAGPFATNLLHTERMLQSEGSYMRKLIGELQQLSELISLVNASEKEEGATPLEEEASKHSSSSSSSTEEDESESTDSASSESSSTEESSESESDDSSSESQPASSDSSSDEEEQAASSSSEEASESSNSSSSSASSDESSSSSTNSSSSDADSD
ncbi:hypothetical protein, conserved [Eimeria acervulina]|uniref:Uncharacterized protein n=1 Tax=Eimeria acervulina TaxID=5801 RepID=U6GKB7_EIMAC|nr:hypothetical protein, conserved [Eimeria acervulina]CDI80610.1 hypothetical protein, conserved [Eimeria acervulina]